MKHYYLTLFFTLVVALCSTESQAQANTTMNLSIEGLTVFPNPVIGTKAISITSKSNSTKTVTIYNVLGKQIQAAVATRKTLNISSLSAGVYILEITQGNASETRKLIIK